MARHEGTTQKERKKKEENPTYLDPRTKEGLDLANAVALPVVVHKPQLQLVDKIGIWADIVL